GLSFASRAPLQAGPKPSAVATTRAPSAQWRRRPVPSTVKANAPSASVVATTFPPGAVPRAAPAPHTSPTLAPLRRRPARAGALPPTPRVLGPFLSRTRPLLLRARLAGLFF